MSTEPDLTRSARRYYRSIRKFERVIGLLRAIFVGTWLGLLDREKLHAVDKLYYDAQAKYQNDAYNLGGLHAWEEQVVKEHFRDRKTLLVAAAGGGREAIALERLGHEVDAFECHPDLIRFGNELLAKQGLSTRIVEAPRDECPELNRRYDGVIIGWGGYMLIQKREHRLRLLRQLREHVDEGAPLLVSFFARPENGQYHKLVALIARSIRRLRRRDLVEVGDDLAPMFAHWFGEEELRRELAAGGFRLEYFSRKQYGHAVAYAANRRGDEPG